MRSRLTPNSLLLWSVEDPSRSTLSNSTLICFAIFMQSFLNSVANRRVQVLKIQRNMNTTAHTLATQVRRSSETPCNLANAACCNTSHGSSCPLLSALHHVTWDPFMIIAARCC